MFNARTRSGCGAAQSEMGPFYCPNDKKVYLDTSFFQELQTRFRGCSGPDTACRFAYAYVVAHEVGHHVQNLMGVLPRVQQAQRAASSEAESKALQVRVELQADCFAGVWAFHTQQQIRLEGRTFGAAMQTAPPSATTCCSAARRAMWCPTASPTAARPSASAGS